MERERLCACSGAFTASILDIILRGVALVYLSTYLRGSVRDFKDTLIIAYLVLINSITMED